MLRDQSIFFWIKFQFQLFAVYWFIWIKYK